MTKNTKGRNVLEKGRKGRKKGRKGRKKGRNVETLRPAVND